VIGCASEFSNLAFTSMSRQIRFFLCPAMRTAIETEGHRIGANVVSSHSSDESAIQFSTSFGTDAYQGRLWTEAADPSHYELLCRAVKKGSVYDRESGLWVKRMSQAAFDTYRAEQQRALSALVARNRNVAVEVLGARVTNDEGSQER
jgi:hypothetical protein